MKNALEFGLNEQSTLKDFIDFFKQIPYDKWCINKLQDRKGRHCAIGFLQILPEQWSRLTYLVSADVIYVNNGNIPDFKSEKRKGIKTRVIKFLESKL